MHNRSSNLFRFSFAVFDLLCLNMVHFVLLLFMQNIPTSREYILLFLINNGAWILCAYTTALYIGKHNSTDNFFRRSVISFFLFTGISLFSIFLYNFSYSRLFVILIFIGFGTIILISRTLYVGAAYYLRKQYTSKKRVVVIGYNELSKTLIQNFSATNSAVSVVGFFEDAVIDKNEFDLPLLGKIDQSVEYAIENSITEIYTTVSPEKNNHIYELAHGQKQILYDLNLCLTLECLLIGMCI